MCMQTKNEVANNDEKNSIELFVLVETTTALFFR